MKLKELLVLEEEKRGDVAVTAILDSVETALTSTGKPYIKGVICDKNHTLTWKLWDHSLDSINSKLKRPLVPNQVISMKGKLTIAPNGQLDFIVGYDKGAPALRIINASVSEYIYEQPFVSSALLDKVKSFVNDFNDGELKEICNRVFETYGKKMEYYPYGTVFHKERGGALYHIYLCMKQASQIEIPYFDREAVVLNKELIMTAILCYRLGIYDCYTVDEATGKILERGAVARTLFHQMDNYTEFLLMVSDKTGDKIEALKHMVLLMSLPTNDIFKPAFKEAEVFMNIIHNELNLYSFGEISSVTFDGNVSAVMPSLRRKVVALDLSPVPVTQPETEEKTEESA